MRMPSLTLALLAVALLCAVESQAEYSIPYSVIACGGEAVGDGTLTLTGTVGQPFIGVLSSASNTNEIGFWYQPGGILTGIEDDLLPTRNWLAQNHPNPFNPVTLLRFSVHRRTRVTLRIYNAAGREVRTLVDAELDPGFYTEVMDARELASGVYFCRMVCDGFTETRKLVLLK